MGRFNSLQSSKYKKEVVNLADGKAYDTTPEYKLVSILLTSFIQDSFYKKASTQLSDIDDLLKLVDPKFAAKAAIYARNEFGMRSPSHYVAARLAPYLSGKLWAKHFYEKVIRRVDDMLEIASIALTPIKLSEEMYLKGKMSNQLKKGLAKAYDKFDSYQLAKYRNENKKLSLRKLTKLVHPIPVERNAEALSQLIAGTLKSKDTWESKMSKAGKEGTKKEDVWIDLLKENRLGYFALLRNLRNIIQTKNKELINIACYNLKNPDKIKKSLVLPFRYTTALTAIEEAGGNRQVEQAINEALEISCDNVPRFEGKTLVVLDTSGSMYPGWTYKVPKNDFKSPVSIGSLFASILYKSNDADLMAFGTNCTYLTNVRYNDSIQTIRQALIATNYGGTNFDLPFLTANKKYDRIVILSDMQGWAGHLKLQESFKNYKEEFNCNPYLYSWDLKGYGSLQFPQNKVCLLAGFSEKVFDLMGMVEQDKNALIKKIQEVKL